MTGRGSTNWSTKLRSKRTSVAGRDTYSAEVMFRIMLVQAWNKLSDYQMEEQLVYNTMFLWFCHLSMENPVPEISDEDSWTRTAEIELGYTYSLLSLVPPDRSIKRQFIFSSEWCNL
ncbi:MAG: transposase [Candidatus Cloacimonetes bacterium]|nr:transposase [Candidatus Cloacimonadota bacterium]